MILDGILSSLKLLFLDEVLVPLRILDIRTVVAAVALNEVVALSAVGHDHLDLGSAFLSWVLLIV